MVTSRHGNVARITINSAILFSEFTGYKWQEIWSFDISVIVNLTIHWKCINWSDGISRDASRLIASYIYKQKRRVKIGEIKSDWKEMYTGVPKRSIWGPLIFNIFTNDLFHCVKQGNIMNHADDNSVSVNHMQLHVISWLLQAEAEVTVKWVSENAMQADTA